MAINTAGIPILSELLAVNVLVAILALSRSGLEINVGQLGFQVRWLVTIRASGSSMRAEEGEIGLGVVEARQVLPRLR